MFRCAAILLALALPCPARAWVRSTVEDDPSTPLFWRFRGVTVRPAYDTSDDVPRDRIRVAVTRSIAAWNTAADPCSDFLLEDGGMPSGLSTNLDGGDADQENRIVWREDVWPEDVPSGTLALTTLVYREASGQIIDADIDLNGVHHFWTDTDTPGSVDTDVQNTLTHELGHLLGLAHAPDPAATMYRESAPGDLEKRTLSEDDVLGLCSIYPAGQPTPLAPDFRPIPLTTGCAAARGRGPGWIAIAFGLSALFLRRRAAPRARARA
jgi:hypothetical protein